MIVRGEFEFRDACIMRYNNNGGQYTDKIHHFNWQGSPVFKYNATPAADSLMYLVSPPKIPEPADELRVNSILTRATKLIDPVILHLEPQCWSSLLSLRASDLARRVTGYVYKFYSKHGCWTDDEREWENNTAVDVGNVHLYKSPDTAISNGFAQFGTFRSRNNLTNEIAANIYASDSRRYRRATSKLRDIRRLGGSKYCFEPSPLRISSTLDDDNGNHHGNSQFTTEENQDDMESSDPDISFYLSSDSETVLDDYDYDYNQSSSMSYANQPITKTLISEARNNPQQQVSIETDENQTDHVHDKSPTSSLPTMNMLQYMKKRKSELQQRVGETTRRATSTIFGSR